MGNSPKNTKCSVMGWTSLPFIFQLCNMSPCKKHAQQVIPLARKSIEGNNLKNDNKCSIKSIKGE